MKTKSIIFQVVWLVLGLAVNLRAGSFKHITIDGSFEDWAGVAPAYIDPPFADDPAYQQDPAPFATALDLKNVYVANDSEYLYVRFTLYAAGDPFTAQQNLFVNADNDSTTGYSAVGSVLIGSEMLVQGGGGYQEKNGLFNEGPIDGLDWLSGPSGEGTDFEFRISRNATYNSDGVAVFVNDTIAFLLETENEVFDTVETAPDTEGLTYTFEPVPVPAAGNVLLLGLTNSTWRVNAVGNDLGSDWRQTGYDDTQAGWDAGLGLFGFTTNAAEYPAPILTPLPATSTTTYLRAHFQWTNDPGSVILVASNFLSDGAVFYLNGAEVKRLRLGPGDVSFGSPATGSPASKGQAEVTTLPAGALVVGENVLAVEIHQTAGDAGELVFGLSLLAATQFPAVITDPEAPADRSVGAGDSTTFSVDFAGTPPLSFQWLKDGGAIADATNATFSLDLVLQGDAGNYALRISNPLSTNTTRAAVLTVTNSPVRVADTSQPADQTTVEGLPITLTSSIVGSAPVSFQWFKGGVPLLNETNASLSLPDVRLLDAGDYYVVATNPFPSSITSRTARLTVNDDVAGPTVSSVLGTPNTVSITFSEAVTPPSALALTNYALSGGLIVASVTQDTNDSARVVLSTSAQTLGTSYTLTINNVLDRFNNVIAPNTQRAFKSQIVIDGSFDDWATVPLALSDPEDSTTSTDYKDVYIINDDDFIYMRVTLHTASALSIVYNNVFVDADNDPSTGYPVAGIGSEMLIQEGAGYQEKNRDFNEGGIDNLDWLLAPEGVGSDFELRFSRHATYASDGLPVFTTNAVTIVLEAENISFQLQETAPDSGGFIYSLAGETQLGPLVITSSQAGIEISWSGPGKLQSRASLATGTWQDVQNPTNPYLIPTNDKEGYYRLIQEP